MWDMWITSSIRANFAGPILDHVTFDSIFDVAEESFVADLIQTYFVESSKTMKLLREAESDTDCIAVKNLAHKLKGSSRSLGLLRIGEICEEIELNPGSKKQVLNFLGLLETQLQCAEKELRTRLTGVCRRKAIGGV